MMRVCVPILVKLRTFMYGWWLLSRGAASFQEGGGGRVTPPPPNETLQMSHDSSHPIGSMQIPLKYMKIIDLPPCAGDAIHPALWKRERSGFDTMMMSYALHVYIWEQADSTLIIYRTVLSSQVRGASPQD